MSTFRIEADWERLGSGSPEERACFAAVGIQLHGVWLTRAEDTFVGRIREKPHLSAYKLAEWLAWNWWRLRWEPFNRRAGWALAHRMTTIGGGYVWPNISVRSDGELIVVMAEPTHRNPSESLHYVENFVGVIRADAFVDAVDLFVEQVIGQLRTERVGGTNLEGIWKDLGEERANPEISSRRRLEALMGFDPDEASIQKIETLIADAKILGGEAIGEIAAGQELLSAEDFNELAKTRGFDASPSDVVRLPNAEHLPGFGDAPPWKRGADAASALRLSEQLGAAPISNARLSSLSGVSSAAISEKLTTEQGGPKTAFALDESATSGRVVLHSKWKTGRRFELARLLGDRIAYGSNEKLHPATHSYTYRQKLQRAFAAELLCPFEALCEMLGDDVSPDAIEDAAEHFDVSEQTIRTSLVNHKILPRDELAEFSSSLYHAA